MRVPSTGLTSDERRIVAEGYALAERLLKDYRDPPTLTETLAKWFTHLRLWVVARD